MDTPQRRLIAQWMHLRFIHGVMNTDNMTISGETIDYGPCAFMEAYNPATVFSSIDHGGRYAYGNQPPIARWNLARLAETLVPLVAMESSDAPDDESALQDAVVEVSAVMDEFQGWYRQAFHQGLMYKLGLAQVPYNDADAALGAEWLTLLEQQRADFTLAWRRLADAAAGDANPVRVQLPDPAVADAWLARWQARCARDDADRSAAGSDRAGRRRSVSPWLVPRNHRVEEALAAASDDNNLAPFEQLLAALQRPFFEDSA